MGTGASKKEPEVHVVVVQSKEDGRIDAQIVRRSKQGQYHPVCTSSRLLLLCSFSSTDSNTNTTVVNGASPVEECITQANNNPRRRRPGILDINGHHHQMESTHHHRARDRSIVQEGHRSVSSIQSSTHGHASPTHRIIDQSDNSSQSIDPVQGTDSNSNNMEFKIFRTANNEEYTVYVREEDGSMFYVDWEQQVGVAYIIYHYYQLHCLFSCTTEVESISFWVEGPWNIWRQQSNCMTSS